jgi:hypothetical protein
MGVSAKSRITSAELVPDNSSVPPSRRAKPNALSWAKRHDQCEGPASARWLPWHRTLGFKASQCSHYRTSLDQEAQTLRVVSWATKNTAKLDIATIFHGIDNLVKMCHKKSFR